MKGAGFKAECAQFPLPLGEGQDEGRSIRPLQSLIDNAPHLPALRAGPFLSQTERKRKRESYPTAPAFFASSQPASPMGRTRAALAAAFGSLAVPSRARPTMPCTIAARRNRL